MAQAPNDTEQTPLLLSTGNENYDSFQDQTAEAENVSQAAQQDVKCSSAVSRYLLQLCTILLIFDFVQYSSYTPLTAVFEEIICNKYYSSRVPTALLLQHDCKIAPVQRELAFVKGYKDTLSQVPSIVFSIPLGLLADRVGRKTVLLLFLLGMFLNDTWVKIVCFFPNQLPIRWVWLGPALKALGGGANFGTSMFFTAAADVIEEKDRADAFMKLFAMEMVVQIAGGPLVSVLMAINNYYPLYVSSVLLVVAGIMAFFLPESHPKYQSTIFGPPKSGQDDRFDPDEEAAQPEESNLQTVRKEIINAYAASASLLTNSGIWLCLFVFLLASCGAHVWAYLIQYVSHKFKWKFSTTNLLFPLRGCITLVLSLGVMGAIDRFIQQRLGIKSARKDLLISMGSCILIVAGLLAVGLAQNVIPMLVGVVVSALGSSLLVSFRCAMISLLPEAPVAPLNAVSGMAQSIGILISGPILPAVYSWGISQGGIWTGIPFLFSSCVHVVALAILIYLRLTYVSVEIP